MGALMRSINWTTTPVGPVGAWPQSLRTALSILLETGFPMYIAWGADFTQFYNDGYRPILGSTKHPAAMGISTRETFAEIWPIIGPMFHDVMAGHSTTVVDFLLPLDRHGFAEECYFVFSYSPIRDESGAVGGVLVTVTETTQRVLGARRLSTLRALAADTRDARSAGEACAIAARVLATNPADLSFARIYLVGPDGDVVEPAGAAGEAPAGAPWPIAEVARTCESATVNLPNGAGRCVVLPVMQQGADRASGVLVAAVSPRLLLDDEYRSFLSLVAAQIGTAVASARALEEAKARADALAELDRAKTTFFSNVSHEFRTPLTLLLGPIENALATQDATLDREQLSLVHRNAQRLLRLVNTLLDFSRIEAGRAQAAFEPTDIAALTREVAGTFRSVMDQAGLQFEIACDAVSAPVYVDRAMWEQVVLNLLSNAFKFTFAGRITVVLRETEGAFELAVRDTGTGIPAAELPHLFDRFRRVEGARSRSFEGSGIGLALVLELVRMHGGTIDADSQEGAGSTFTVRVPTGASHLAPEHVTAAASGVTGGPRRTPFVDEARRWAAPQEAAGLAATSAARQPAADPAGDRDLRARVLVVDDNADMRDYLCGLLEPHWQVQTASNGIAALAAVAAQAFDLVLTDVMMPEVDGFELMRRLRADPLTRTLPVIVLSARAGEEARVEGLDAGADDYLVKPFAARELVARVRTQIELSRLRRDAAVQRDRLLTLFDLAPAAIAVVRGPAHVYELANERYLQLVGRPDIVGKPGRTALPELVPQGVWDLFDRVYASGEVYVTRGFEAKLDRHHTGTLEEGYFDFSLQPLKNARGQTEGILIHVVEVTESFLAARRIDEARQAAESANRAKDEFLAMLGHELRNPLAPILTALQLMTLRGDIGAERERAVIDRQVRHVVRLVDDLLDVSRITRGKVDLRTERVELAQIVGRAIEMASPLIEQRQHDLDVHVAQEGLAVSGDPARLQQVVLNLLTNAAKYTEPKGRISVSAKREGDRIVLRVVDSGVGITPLMLPQVFDLFAQERQSLDRSQGGLGLGLTIVRRLVELHGGSVEGHSEGIGRGSEFVVRLPVAEAATADTRPQPTGRELGGAAVIGRLRILIAEDNPDTAMVLAQALEALGHDTRAAADGPAALRIAASFKPQVALLDLGLPVMDGYELAGHLREIEAPPKMIAITGYGQETDRRRSRASGFDAHMVKPIDLPALQDILDTLGKR